MPKETRVPQAPSEPMPELAEFLSQFRIIFTQQRSAQTLERYVTGLLTEHPNKNGDTLATVVPGTNQQQLNHLLSALQWDEQELNRQRVKALLALPTEGDGVLIFDETGFAKQGLCSVGVARQYSGTLGKVANCQVTVNCHYAERTIAWPVTTRLYLPKQWVADEQRRRAAHVPESLMAQTKAEIALSLLDEARASAIRAACVVADADYGDNPQFLNGLEERGARSCVAVRANFSVTLARRADAPVVRADAVLAAVPRWQWRTIEWSEGSAGRLRAKFVAVRCWRVDGSGTRHLGWLIGQRAGRGQVSEDKYFWSDFPASTPLERMVEDAHRRHWVEQYHEEAKGELGWDQYQGRLWEGFHRHAATVLLSYRFLVWMEWRQREARRVRGRRRGAFSPSQGPETVLASGYPPAHR